jgi:hypothetical protein
LDQTGQEVAEAEGHVVVMERLWALEAERCKMFDKN